MIAERQTFEHKRIMMDGSSFYGCHFKQCQLVYAGTLQIALEDCTYEDCRWDFDGPASRTLELLRGLYARGDPTATVVATIFAKICGHKSDQQLHS